MGPTPRAGFTPLDDVVAVVLSACPPLPARPVRLADALGCVTAADVTASVDVPPFANSAMDGFAVRAADTAGAPVHLRVIDTARAGRAATRGIGRGEAVRTMTGAPIADGADAVVVVERTDPAGPPDDPGAVIQVAVVAQPGDHIRPIGDDVAVGDVVVAAGTELGPAHLGLLAAVGVSTVLVHPRPRVGVLSTGDELGTGPETQGAGASARIHDANRPMLVAALDRVGCEPVDLGVVADDPDALAHALTAAARTCDAVVTSGGVSVGDFDHVGAVLGEVGHAQAYKVAIKPAKPFVLGRLGAIPVFGLPGNPVSSLVSFTVLAVPGLRRLRGATPARPEPLAGVAVAPLSRRADGKVHLVRVRTTGHVGGVPHVVPVRAQGSHQLQASASADALAVVPDGTGVDAGQPVALIPLP